VDTEAARKTSIENQGSVMVQRHDVEFPVEGGMTLRGWLFVPEGRAPHPAITMAHGFAGVKEHGLERFARAFADAGFVVLVHDHRGFGASGGSPRFDVDPWVQIADWRRAISFLEAHSAVDADRIGLWGSSYAGGHAIVLAATDRRVRAVVAQVPTISGYQQSLRRVPPDQVPALEAAFADDERHLFHGAPPTTQAVVSLDPAVPAAYRSADAVAFYNQPVPECVWENTVTLRSTRAARMYEPGMWISRVSPTPLLMVVALHDTITVTDLALSAYERALQPKQLVTIEGNHFAPYVARFADASGAAMAWFTEHLTKAEKI
jgi:cephalosporin-C deacetylase-like acetyl esterase